MKMGMGYIVFIGRGNRRVLLCRLGSGRVGNMRDWVGVVRWKERVMRNILKGNALWCQVETLWKVYSHKYTRINSTATTINSG